MGIHEHVLCTIRDITASSPFQDARDIDQSGVYSHENICLLQKGVTWLRDHKVETSPTCWRPHIGLQILTLSRMFDLDQNLTLTRI